MNNGDRSEFRFFEAIQVTLLTKVELKVIRKEILILIYCQNKVALDYKRTDRS